jgi:RimJ/RimL family protein N-acetyltransferase
MTVLTTPRLRLEPMSAAHFEALHAMNSDPDVMRYISGRPETPEETRASIERVEGRWRDLGYSWWCFIELTTGELVGAGCIQHLGQDRANPLEIGWRLRTDKRGQGLASEAAHRMAQFAFDTLAAPLLCAICHPQNRKSSRVMERLGMHYLGEEEWNGTTTSRYQLSRAAWYARDPPARPTGR